MLRTDRFQLGKIYLTPGAISLLQKHHRDAGELLSRHRSGDYGEVCALDRQVNEEALLCGGRILSAYQVGGRTIWIQTDQTRTSTIILTPEEY